MTQAPKGVPGSLQEQLVRDLGVQGTPALIYRSGDHVMQVIRSASDPAKLKSIVSAAAPD